MKNFLPLLSSIKTSSLPVILPLALLWCAQASAEQLYSTGADGTALYTIDSNTGAGTLIGDFSFTGTYALALSPSGTLYGVSGGYGAGTLDIVNPLTGASTHVGASTGISDLMALKFGPDGVLYAASWSTNMLYTMNPATGVATPVGSLGFSGIMDIAFDSSGQLYGLAQNLYKINKTTGAGTLFTSLTDSSLMGLTIDSSGRFLATDYVSNSPLYQINTTTGALTSLGQTGISQPMALTEQSVPEPGSTALLGLAGLLTMGRRRRKAPGETKA